MRRALGALALFCALTAAACGSSGSLPSSRACQLMTAGDVSAALGVPVSPQPPPTPPPSPSTGRLVGACGYAATAAPAGASLFLYRNLSLRQLEALPGSRRLDGPGAAVLRPSMLFGETSGTGFQIVLVWSADEPRRDRVLVRLGRLVARRLASGR